VPLGGETAVSAIEAAEPGMTRGVEHAGREGGEGNRRRRDRHRRGDRGERHDRSGPQGGEPGSDRADAPAAAAGLAPMVDVTHLAPAEAPPQPPSVQRAIEPERVPSPSAEDTVILIPPRASPPEVIPTPPAVTPPARPTETLPPVSMSLPADSGLEMIETRSKGTTMPEPETAPAPGPRRVRPPRVVVSDEPLQIVETRKDSPAPPG
jgi:hypothetical protein